MPQLPLDRRRALVAGVVALLVLVVAGKLLLRPQPPAVPPPVRVAARAAARAAGGRPGHRAEDSRLPAAARCFRLGRRARCDPGHRSGPAGDAARSGRPVSVARLRLAPLGHTSTLLAAFLCLGLATANLARVESAVVPAAALLAGMFGASRKPRRVGLLAVALALAGWWWGSARLDALDYSSLTGRLETAGRARAIVTGPARRGKYDVRAPGVVTRFAGQALREPVLLKLPLGRAPPQGA